MSGPDDGPDRTRRLTDISRALTYARSIEEVLDLTVDCACDLLEADQAILMLSDGDGLLHIRAARGIEAHVVARFREPLDENLLQRLTAVIGPDARDRFLGVPLVVRGAVIGLLGVRLPGGAAAPEDGEWLLSALADQAAVALESTRHQAVHDELAARVERLQHSDRQRGHALEILGHDLRSPLNAVLGYAALLSGEVLGPINHRQRDALHKLKRVASHLESIVANVLEMSRLNSDSVRIQAGHTAVRPVVEEALDMLLPAATDAGISFHVHGDPQLALHTDADYLRQVLVHLLDNAVKYAPSGSEVAVKWQQTLAGGRTWVEVSVADQGPGVPPERQNSIFDAYVRQSGDSPRAQSGVGLGLAIASGVVRRLGGMLVLDSQPGRGATFTVRLPAAGSAPEPPPDPTEDMR